MLSVRHPPLAPGHIDRPHLWADLGDLLLESGQVIRDYRQCYVTHGKLDRRRPRVALLLPAIGATHHRLDFLIGPGRALDPAHWFIVVADPLGNGLSTSPSNSRHQSWETFPRFCIRDMIAAQHMLLTRVLGIETATVVIGASMGGMQALQWMVSHPGFFESMVAMTPLARTGPWTLAANAAARAALTADPAWDGRRFNRVPERGWRAWSAIQQVLTNRTPRGLAVAFAESRDVLDWMDALAARACVSGPDPHDFLYQSWAYDTHDVGGTAGWHGDTEAALGAIRARTLLLTAPLDLYNPVEEAQAVAEHIPGARHVVIPSVNGHQAANTADPDDVAFVNDAIRAFLA
ncbi:alpha/beta fold hydrolase [Parapusillimonas sp. SGNA-6]|nr:alpha/beta fold hydrolase [Parapusillimonas sp. SGNA-6]